MTALVTSASCPAAGCGEETTEEGRRFACSRHWRMVPRNVVRMLDEAERYGSIAEHQKAVDRVVRSLHAAVANRERQLAGRRS